MHKPDMQNRHRKNIRNGREKKQVCNTYLDFLIPKLSGTDPNLCNKLRLKFQPKNELAQTYRE